MARGNFAKARQRMTDGGRGSGPGRGVCVTLCMSVAHASVRGNETWGASDGSSETR